MTVTPQECAGEVLETIPLIMRTIRARMRAAPPLNLSVPQFRTLMFLRRHEGASLSDAAEHLGLSLPSTSKLVDGLVAHDVLMRQPHPGDRRRVTLTLTAGGRSTLRTVQEAAQAHLAKLLTALPADRREVVVEAMGALREVFAPDRAQAAERVGGRT